MRARTAARAQLFVASRRCRYGLFAVNVAAVALAAAFLLCAGAA